MDNIVRKGEIACNKQFLLFSQCFLPFMILIFHFKYTIKCRLQFISIWACLKFVNTFSNDKYWTLPNSQNMQTTISNLMKVAEGSPNGWKTQ